VYTVVARFLPSPIILAEWSAGYAGGAALIAAIPVGPAMCVRESLRVKGFVLFLVGFIGTTALVLLPTAPAHCGYVPLYNPVLDCGGGSGKTCP
jgi:hypothetical protein